MAFNNLDPRVQQEWVKQQGNLAGIGMKHNLANQKPGGIGMSNPLYGGWGYTPQASTGGNAGARYMSNAQKYGANLDYQLGMASLPYGLANTLASSIPAADASKYGSMANYLGTLAQTGAQNYGNELGYRATMESQPWNLANTMAQSYPAAQASMYGSQMGYRSAQAGAQAQIAAAKAAAEANKYGSEMGYYGDLAGAQAGMYGAGQAADANRFGTLGNYMASLANTQGNVHAADRAADANMYGSYTDYLSDLAGTDAARYAANQGVLQQGVASQGDYLSTLAGADAQRYSADQARMADTYDSLMGYKAAEASAYYPAAAEVATAHYDPWAATQAARMGALSNQNVAQIEQEGSLAKMLGILAAAKQLGQPMTPSMPSIGTNYGAGITA